MPKVFFSYSHADEDLRDQLETQLALLKRQGVIEAWHDRRIGAGMELGGSIDTQLEAADIVLLLVSSDFMASDYCYNIEMTRAMERQADGSVVVIPVILRPCLWHDAPFGKLMATPTDGKAVTQFPDRDVAFLEVAQAIKGAAARFGSKPAPASTATKAAALGPVGAGVPSGPRSSNLRLTKTFTERDHDRFRLDAFEYMSKFFENSLAELEQRNSGIEGAFRRIDANRFTAAIYHDGKAQARCTVFTGGDRFMGSGINYLQGETTETNSYNESLNVKCDDQTMYLESLMGGHRRPERSEKMSHEGAAEYYWAMLIEPLQRGR